MTMKEFKAKAQKLFGWTSFLGGIWVLFYLGIVHNFSSYDSLWVNVVLFIGYLVASIGLFWMGMKIKKERSFLPMAVN